MRFRWIGNDLFDTRRGNIPVGKVNPVKGLSVIDSDNFRIAIGEHMVTNENYVTSIPEPDVISDSAVLLVVAAILILS